MVDGVTIDFVLVTPSNGRDGQINLGGLTNNPLGRISFWALFRVMRHSNPSIFIGFHFQ